MTTQLDAAQSIVRTLVDNGYEALFAGGYVRDMLWELGQPTDIDIATSATPPIIARLFRRTIGVGEHFGVMVVLIDEWQFEVATFRSDVGATDGRHPDQVVFCSAELDAQRRDFTINGLFFDPLSGKTIDYVNGSADIASRTLRAIGNPAQRFTEDYLRLLRAIRFTTRFNLHIDPQTWDALVAAAPGITRVSAERIYTELTKILTGNNPHTGIRLLHESGLLRIVLPEVAAMDGVEQPPQFHPEGDVLVHTLLALSHLQSPDAVLGWATLLHDIGKPPTQTLDETGRLRFNNHHRKGAVMAYHVLKRLHAPGALIDDVAACVDNHMNFMNVRTMRLSTLRRFMGAPTFNQELAMHRADCLASHGGLENFDFLQIKKVEYANTPVKPPPILCGKDLIALGLKPGPHFGTILGQAYDLQLENELDTHEAAVGWAQQHIGEWRLLEEQSLLAVKNKKAPTPD